MYLSNISLSSNFFGVIPALFLSCSQIASISGNQVDELDEINSELDINTEDTADTATGGAVIAGPGVVGGSVSSGGASSGGGGY